VKTLCHPDGSAKVTGGTTGAGATSAVAVSSGMTFSDGTPESKVTLSLALALKEKLLARGYDVLMIRESDDVQLDNIARTVIANNAADCHVALHWDSTTSNKGAFYMSVPNVSSYRSMEPVASHWQQHHALGESLISGLKGVGVKIFSSGRMDMDLTQTSYSTIPSVDIELGDKVSDHSKTTIDNLAQGLADGIDQFFVN
jgi:N-acetylmuramoyl-L-alanine amidase